MMAPAPGDWRHLHAGRVIFALTRGFGVEDIQARGIATAADARDVVRRLREGGWLMDVVGRVD